MSKRARIGMAMFLIADGVFFFLLILASIYFRDAGSGKLHLAGSSIYTAILLASALAMWRAASGSRAWIAVTIALGVVFLAGQGSESISLIRSGMTMSQSLFGTTFFTLSAMFGLQMVIAIAALAILPAAVRVVGMYWYFLAAVWVAIFAATYARSAL